MRSSDSRDCDSPQEQQREADGLPDQLQELRLPGLERRREELSEELRPPEALSVLRGLVLFDNQLSHELPKPGQQEEQPGHETVRFREPRLPTSLLWVEARGVSLVHACASGSHWRRSATVGTSRPEWWRGTWRGRVGGRRSCSRSIVA
jgi:hypothetical protein